jgi:hypothetical protein
MQFNVNEENSLWLVSCRAATSLDDKTTHSREEDRPISIKNSKSPYCFTIIRHNLIRLSASAGVIIILGIVQPNRATFYLDHRQFYIIAVGRAEARPRTLIGYGECMALSNATRSCKHFYSKRQLSAA